MNTEEQTLIDGLFTRIKQAEDPQQPRDAQAQARIEEHLRQQPAAPYYMAQAILVQEAALKQLDARNKELEAELKQARERAQEAPRSSGGGFLSGLFGGAGNSSRPTPEPQRSVAPPPSAGGWRETPSQPYTPPPQAQSQGFGAAPARSGASSFLGGAMQTAAGVAGGVLLAQGISSLFSHHSQPDEVVEVIREEPAPASDTGGWNDQDSQRQVADNNDWSNGQDGGFADSDYDASGGSFFDDDDTFV